MAKAYPRVIIFDNIPNFRGLGGYKAGRGKTIALGRLYRSGALLDMTASDKTRLKEEIRLKTVIDLRPPDELRRIRESNLLEEIGARYFNIPFRPDVPNYYAKEMAMYANHATMGAVYLERIKHRGFDRKLFQALEIIADEQYHPVLFHCAAGKDRTGILAAAVLSLLGVSDEDIVNDYVITDSAMPGIRQQIVDDPATGEEIKNLPDFTWRAAPESMIEFLAGVRKEYGGMTGYLKKHGAEKTLVKRLGKVLLV